jgi:CheY-like chemotaxis protein
MIVSMSLHSVAAEVLACLADATRSLSAAELAARTGATLDDVVAACALLSDWRLLHSDSEASFALSGHRARGSAPLVLVVENTASVANVLGALLETDGYRVLLASALSTGMAVLRAVKPAAVIADSFSSSSAEALQRLQPLLRAGAPAPVLLFTGHRDVSEETAKVAGFAGILPKPFDIDALLARIAGITGRGEQENER